jgi:transcriptional regulator with XRE-family HTH domain
MKKLSNKEFIRKTMKDPKFRTEYYALAPEFELLEKMLKVRAASGLTQAQIAKKMHITTGQNIPAKVIHAEIRDKHQETYGTTGYYLRLFRNRASLSQVKLADNIGIKQHHISEMEKNKRPVGKNLAKKLAVVLSCDYKKFL